VVGDLTSVFDFATPNRGTFNLPDTDAYLPTDLTRQPNYALAVPATQAMPTQEKGVRPARALPYAPHAHGRTNVVDGAFAIDFVNTGRATVVYQVRSAGGAHAPRSYTVEAGKQLAGVWPVKAQGQTAYELEVHGPNGFYRAFQGGVDSLSTRLLVRAAYDAARNDIVLSITNQSEHKAAVRVADGYTAKAEKRRLSVGETAMLRWSLERTRGWYDLLVTVDGDSAYATQLAGHLENGRHSITDPAMGGVVIKQDD